MKETGRQRHQFKKMFDSLPEGIVVLHTDRIMFINDLAQKLLTAVSGMHNFG